MKAFWCKRFQSLSGFQVRCNYIKKNLPYFKKLVSIPIGFSSSLQPYITSATIIHAISFNPYRVFKFVATHFRSSCDNRQQSFNPYRVFKFVATLRTTYSRNSKNMRFNPYRVFKFVATPRCMPYRGDEVLVSIPIGFSSSLQPVFLRRTHKYLRTVSIPIGFSSSLQLLIA